MDEVVALYGRGFIVRAFMPGTPEQWGFRRLLVAIVVYLLARGLWHLRHRKEEADPVFLKPGTLVNRPSPDPAHKGSGAHTREHPRHHPPPTTPHTMPPMRRFVLVDERLNDSESFYRSRQPRQAALKEATGLCRGSRERTIRLRERGDVFMPDLDLLVRP
jgi:hypothetical protein